MAREDDKLTPYQALLLEYYEKMHHAADLLPPEEREMLEEWDRKFVDGSGRYATSDWPGWEKYIGKKPTPPNR